MPPSAAMLDHLGGNVTTLCSIWKMTASDATVAAYASHTRSLVFGGTTYSPAQVEASRFTQTLGLQPNNVELFGIFDSIVTEADLQGGRWKNARMQYEIVNYKDLTMGSIGLMKGRAGKFDIDNGTFRVELRSLSDLLHQEIGDLTSPLDRNRSPADLGVSLTAFTFARTVTAFTDRANFTVDGAAQVDNYFRYGKATFTSGANAGLLMEIKSSVGNVLTLQLPMRSAIAIGNTVSLIAGYDSTIEQCRDRFGAAAVLNFQGEPHLPGIKTLLKYPE